VTSKHKSTTTNDMIMMQFTLSVYVYTRTFVGLLSQRKISIDR